MPRYRSALPQLSGELFLTDGGLETTLIFHGGFDLPCFAAFPLVEHERGREAIATYFRSYLGIARSHGVGLVLDSPTWRASAEWGEHLGYTEDTLAAANRAAIGLLAELRETAPTGGRPVVLSGCIGPHSDAYSPAHRLAAEEAERYHAPQIGVLADTQADLVTALTLTYPEEAIGITRAAVAAGMPVAISFTVETDGRLPIGTSLEGAIDAVDRATGAAPAYYMINCAHPNHFERVLVPGAPWSERIRGIRANASKMSHAELDEAEELDDGDPVELAASFADLRRRFPQLTVLGGCCGTDHRHLDAIAAACSGQP